MDYIKNIIESLQEIIQIKTVQDNPVEGGPFGLGNKQCLEKVLSLCDKLGFKTKNLDGYCGYAEIGEGDEIVGIIGHLDVVPEGDGWKYPPYSAKIVDGEMWGRGTWDDKGPVMISIYAIKALMDEGFKFNKKVRLIFGCNEESGSRCVAHYLKVEGDISYGVSPDSAFPVIFGEKTINGILISGDSVDSGGVKLVSLDGGIVVNAVPDICRFTLTYQDEKEINKVLTTLTKYFKENSIESSYKKEDGKVLYEVYGKACHGSVPQYGVNAISYALVGLSKAIDNSFAKFYANCIGTCVHGEKMGCFAEDEYGKIAVNIGIAKMENGKFNIAINSRLPFNTNSKLMVDQIKETVKDYNVEVKLLGDSKGFLIDKDSIMIKSLVEAYQKVTHDYESKPICSAGGTYAREFNNCVAFGPEMKGYGEIIIHQPNERIQLRAIEDIFKIYKSAYKDLIEKVSFK